MANADWDEIKRLAADFQKAQLSSTSQRLSERNCVEIVTKLIELKLIDVIFTTDGKEYLTSQQLVKEIKDELYVHGGRVNTVDLAKELNVDLSQINACLSEITKSKDTTLISGHLLSNSYLEKVAREVNERLQQQGQLKVADLTLQFDLPAEYIQHNILEKYLGKIIKGKKDPSDPRIYYTEEFIARSKSKIFGAVIGLSRPTPVSLIIGQCDIPEKLFASLFDEVKAPGSLTGRQSNAQYIPHCYTKSQIEWVTNFYQQNSYLEYDAITRLGITDFKAFIKRHIPNEDLIYLKTVVISPMIKDQLQVALDECIASKSFVDVLSILPSVMSEADIEMLLEIVLKDLGKATVLFENTIFSTSYIEKLSALCSNLLKKNAERVVENGTFQQYCLERQVTSRLPETHSSYVDVKAERKEERRRKAAGGKGGGGTQGRETKTKAVKKHQRGGNKNAQDSDSDDNSSSQTKRSNLVFEIVQVNEIEDVIKAELENEGLDDVVSSLAQYLHSNINQEALQLAKEASDKLLQNASQSRKQTHSAIQDKINSIVNDIRLYEKGIKLFPSDQQGALTKYLLKTFGGDVLNELCKYAASQCNLQIPDELTVEHRNKILNDLSADYKKSFQNLLANLNESVDAFLQALDECLEICGMILKKVDKKKDRPIIQTHKEKLVEELQMCSEPALVLHLSVLILFTAATQCMLHASGRFVPAIISFLQPHLRGEGDGAELLGAFFDSVSKYLSASEDEKSAMKEQLSEKQDHLKKFVQNYKK